MRSSVSPTTHTPVRIFIVHPLFIAHQYNFFWKTTRIEPFFTLFQYRVHELLMMIHWHWSWIHPLTMYTHGSIHVTASSALNSALISASFGYRSSDLAFYSHHPLSVSAEFASKSDQIARGAISRKRRFPFRVMNSNCDKANVALK